MHLRGPVSVLTGLALAALLVVPLAFVLISATAPTAPPTTPTARLQVTVTTNAEAYPSADPVHITVEVRNVGNATAYLVFPSACQASFRIRSTGGSIVYDRSDHTTCGAVVTNLTLVPGGSKSYAMVWDQTSDTGFPVATGRTYRVEGVLLRSERFPEMTAQTSILIEAGGPELNLVFAAQTDRAAYSPGDSANVTVVLTNIGITTAVLHFSSGCIVQFLVYDAAQHAVYNSSRHFGCVQVLTDVILEPGASRSWRFAWNLSWDNGSPLASDQEYTVVPSFFWADASPYQQYVSRTDVATFHIVSFEVTG